MPINIPSMLPAKAQLESENIFVMTNERAVRQDIRPLKIAILNLMPEKIITEAQLLRLLGNTPLQVDIELVRPDSHMSKNTPKSHLLAFYKPFSEVRENKYDGFIITGAPIEHLDYSAVSYWHELSEIMDYTRTNVTSTLHICWGAQAGLFHHYSINKIPLEKKVFGVFLYKTMDEHSVLMRGFDGIFSAPQSRWTNIDEESLISLQDIIVLAKSDEVGIHIAASKNYSQIFVFGHMEYDANTLANEYKRDMEKGLNPEIPRNYFPHDDPTKDPVINWRAHANLFFFNWLNYCVYQVTPFVY